MIKKHSMLGALLLCLLALAAAGLGETIEVQNTPIKGEILLGKSGIADDGTETLLVDAVFEVRAAEAVVGLDGTNWYMPGEVAATLITGEGGTAVSPLLPLGNYEIIETIAPEGYVRNETVYPITLKAEDHVTPVVIETLAVTNCENEVLLQKTDPEGNPLSGAEFCLFDENHRRIMSAVSNDEGIVRFTKVPDGEYTIRETSAPAGYLLNRQVIYLTMNCEWTNTGIPIATLVDQPKRVYFLKVDTSGNPLPGVAFSLIDTSTGETAETAVSDENGRFVFTQFDYGDWIIREVEAPEEYCRMEDVHLHVDDGWTEPAPITCINIPNHFSFVKTDASGKKLKGAKFHLEDEDGNPLGEYTSDANGLVEIEDLEPGNYVLRETEAPDGYVVSKKTLEFSIDKEYEIPDELPTFINYTEIQTGVNFVVTTVMWIGLGMMTGSAMLFLIRRRKRHAGRN